MASPCLGKAAPHYESEEDTATAPHPREATTEAAERQLPEHRGGVEQCHRSLAMAQCRDRAQFCPVCCELGWGAAASQYCVHSAEQLQFSFLTCCVVREENFLLYARGTLA